MATKRVVVVCGWLGAKSRPVSKYTELYGAMGYDTVVLLSGEADLLKPHRFVHANAVAQVFMPLKSSPDDVLELIPHMLSNGGCRSWYSVENYLCAADVRYVVPAMVFDSAPSTNVWDSANYAWRATTELPTFLARLATRAMLIGMKWYPTVTRTQDSFEAHWDRYFRSQPHVPKLFLYSPSDNIVDPSHVRAAIACAKSHGGDVDVLEVPGAKHVSILTHAPELYATTVRNFLRKHLAPK
ncbi:hypothetical protein ACHHYP_07602 [Achlya hypogyna]|uniref:Uncharacterized protein n=1 Tax=Achlya hypogyna TaxID=1202772 RepID=A0A1V9ZLT3_ACHHY|nr:hypothetical protein ACHHYP_07602 [Achlya hypogyna]